MPVEKEPFGRHRFTRRGRTEPSVDMIEAVTEIVDDLLDTDDGLHEQHGSYSGFYGEGILYTIQSGTVTNLRSGTTYPRMHANVSTIDKNMSVTADPVNGHQVEINGQHIASDLQAKVIGKSVLSFASGAAEIEVDPARFDLYDPVEVLHAEVQALLAAKMTQETPDYKSSAEEITERDQRFFERVPRSIYRAIKETGRGLFTERCSRQMMHPEGYMVHVSQAEETIETGDSAQRYSRWAADVSYHRTIEDTLGTVDAEKRRTIHIDDRFVLPNISETVVPMHASLKPAFKDLPSNMLRQKYKRERGWSAKFGDMLDFIAILEAHEA